MDREEFSVEMGKADIVITHGGTGAIIGAVKKGKKVIAVTIYMQLHTEVHSEKVCMFMPRKSGAKK